MNLTSFPYIPKHILLRRYYEVNIYDIKDDESYIIDDEAYGLLQKIDGQTSIGELMEQFPEDKHDEISEALEQFAELNIIKLHPQKITDQNSISTDHINLPQKNPFDPPHLKNLMINITERCNLSCKHCYITEKHTTDMDLDKLKNLITDFYALQGSRLILTGGEPFLYNRMKELLEFLMDIPLQKVILSNGLLLQENSKLLELLKENHIEVYISLDGMETSHNDFRNAECFQETIGGINYLLQNHIDVSINTMVHKGNLTEFDAMYQLLSSLGIIKNWSIDIPTFDEDTPQEVIDTYSISPEEGGAILKDYGWGVIYESEGGGDPVDFACGPYLMAVDVMGRVTKCGFFTEESPGNIFESGMKGAWERIQKEVNWSIHDLVCAETGCEYLGECRGGCRYRAYKLNEDIKGVDAFKCVQFGRDYKLSKN